jgi:hypothetical protein
MKKWWQSKTINFNAIFLAIIAIVTQGFGIDIPAEWIAAAQTFLNIILRLITKQPIG